MKKLALSLLFSTTFLINISAIPITTNLGPIQLITSNGSGTFAPGTVSLSGTINIGQSSSDMITIQGSGINYPSSGTSFLLINSSGNIVTAGGGSSTFNCGSLVAAPASGQSITLGMPSNNYLNFTSNSGNVTLQANNANANLALSANGHITLSSADISAPSSGTSFLMVNSSGNMVSAGGGSSTFNCGNLVAAPASGQSVTLGMPSNNYLNFTSNSGNITLQANNANANLALSANGHITLSSADISAPSSGTSFLMVNSSGNMVSAGGGSSTFNCGNLVAAPASGQSVTLGMPSNNYLNFTSNSGNVTLQANNTNANLALSANNNITISSTNVNPSANNTGYVILATDRSGNIITANSNNIFKIGSDASGNNYISIDNANLANGINLNSNAVYLQGQNLSPASGSTNILTIDSNGKLGIVLSAKAYKKDIKSIKLNSSFDSIKPVSYQYKNSDRIEYGFLAEDLMENEALKHAVIFEPDGITPMSINYQTIFVAFIADYLETKKEIKALKKKITTKDDTINKLTLKCEELESIIFEIANKIQI